MAKATLAARISQSVMLRVSYQCTYVSTRKACGESADQLGRICKL